jgi:hypothetical protein
MLHTLLVFLTSDEINESWLSGGTQLPERIDCRVLRSQSMWFVRNRTPEAQIPDQNRNRLVIRKLLYPSEHCARAEFRFDLTVVQSTDDCFRSCSFEAFTILRIAELGKDRSCQ